MKRNEVEGLQPDVLCWARKSIGLSQGEVAARVKQELKEIEAWESGNAAPTYAQLEKLAYEIYKRPIALFFLPHPPQEQMPKTEFRTLPESELEELLPDTILHIRKAHAYQLALVEVFEGSSPSKKQIWVDVIAHLTDDVHECAKAIREYLEIDIQLQSKWKDSDRALKAWRKAIEDKGIFVFKSSFKQSDISGFCLSDMHFPLIYLNNSTTKTRQIFSLLHELGHLLFKENGLSKFDTSYIEFLPSVAQKIEQFCNALAAAILIPFDDFEFSSRHLPYEVEGVEDHEISKLATRYGVSREAILRRFLDQNRVSSAYYQRKAQYWALQQKKGKGGNWYASANSYLSERFASEVVSRHYRKQLSMEHAAELLGIKAKNFEGLEQRILQGAIT